ncbi:hypothetical protein GCM10010191_47870 [Actinomadura vinacea]|uniref:DUF695 domain-containing protein n=1 Tax=Actinomadura vinacea TaxID=115336 RepID=A0ABN3JFS2_9ACTN
MADYRVLLEAETPLPDGHIALATVRPGQVRLAIDPNHISRPLVDDLEEYFRHLAHAPVLCVVPERVGQIDRAEWDCAYERADPDRLPGRTFGLRIGQDEVTGRPWYLFVVRADMMSAELCDEFNNWLLPRYVPAMPYTATYHPEWLPPRASPIVHPPRAAVLVR